MPGLIRQNRKGHGFFRRRRQAKFVGESQPQSERSEFAGQHRHECTVFSSPAGKNQFLKTRLPRGVSNSLRRTAAPHPQLTSLSVP